MSESPLTIEEYRALVSGLPRPTAEQMRDFAHHVAGAHSWYKHLPLWPPGVPFRFFLDPSAGMQRVVTADGSMDVIDRDVRGFHYSWLPTRDYRRRFGFLAFACSAGTAVSMVTQGVGQLVPSDKDATIFDQEKLRLAAVPPEVLRHGTAYASSLIHNSSLAHPRALLETYARGFMSDPPLPDRSAHETVRERVRILCARGCAGLREDAWPADSGGSDALQAILVRCCELTPDFSGTQALSAEGALARAHAARQSRLEDPLHTLLDRERERQRRGMVAAMERVLALLA